MGWEQRQDKFVVKAAVGTKWMRNKDSFYRDVQTVEESGLTFFQLKS